MLWRITDDEQITKSILDESDLSGQMNISYKLTTLALKVVWYVIIVLSELVLKQKDIRGKVALNKINQCDL